MTPSMIAIRFPPSPSLGPHGVCTPAIAESNVCLPCAGMAPNRGGLDRPAVGLYRGLRCVAARLGAVAGGDL